MLLLLLAAALHAEIRWQSTLSPHFTVSHESKWAPPGFVTRLEKLHNRLRRDLAMFSPWMAKERVNLFLYQTQASYLAGEFQPPSWSNGLSIMERKAVAVYERPSLRELEAIIAHEMTHLLFQGYWREAGKTAPYWINEGLAMLEEADNPLEPEKHDRYQVMAYWPIEKALPIERFVALSPSEDLGDDKDKVGDWYTQAYSLAYFLYRGSTGRGSAQLQFKNFCSSLRDGRDLEEAVRLSYRYGKLADLEKAWRKWLADPLHRRKVERHLSQRNARADADEGHSFRALKTFGNLELKPAPTTFYKPRGE